mmetsp:Transcript_1415/g.3505  ORF Transcript_1415/g.3505 Transcript_1415/m.3505 type:complete len:252 (-) Transcript_1415:267-1022(-)
MLHGLSMRRKELRNEKTKIDSQSVTLMSELQTSLTNEEDLTVIGADTFKDNALIEDSTHSDDDAIMEEDQKPSQQELTEFWKPHMMKRRDSPTFPQQAGLSCFSQEVLSPLFVNRGGGGIVEAIRGTLSFGEDNSVVDTHPTLQAAASHPSPGAISAGARAWRERNGRSASQGIDFRTGLSGHMALLSSNAHAHPHDDLSRPTQSALKISSHSGLTVRPPSRRQRAPPSIPNFSPGWGGEETKESPGSTTP